EPVRRTERFVDQLRPGTGAVAFRRSWLGSVTCPDGANLALYKASKAALTSMSNALVTELGGNRPTVLSMHPGWVKTDMGGEHAAIDVMTSTTGLVEQLNAYPGKGGHHFIDYQGKTIAW
ncbi:SDR family NAD(P)-dependent oxidoreductase, partial [Pseudomonas syringae]